MSKAAAYNACDSPVMHAAATSLLSKMVLPVPPPVQHRGGQVNPVSKPAMPRTHLDIFLGELATKLLVQQGEH